MFQSSGGTEGRERSTGRRGRLRWKSDAGGSDGTVVRPLLAYFGDEARQPVEALQGLPHLANQLRGDAERRDDLPARSSPAVRFTPPPRVKIHVVGRVGTE